MKFIKGIYENVTELNYENHYDKIITEYNISNSTIAPYSEPDENCNIVKNDLMDVKFYKSNIKQAILFKFDELDELCKYCVRSLSRSVMKDIIKNLEIKHNVTILFTRNRTIIAIIPDDFILENLIIKYKGKIIIFPNGTYIKETETSYNIVKKHYYINDYYYEIFFKLVIKELFTLNYTTKNLLDDITNFGNKKMRIIDECYELLSGKKGRPCKFIGENIYSTFL
jgi:DNA polymerase elongation subunit (family B)